MSEVRPDGIGQGPAVVVRVYRHGELVHTERCESEEDAADLVEWWEENPGVECEVDDLSTTHHEDTGEVGASYRNDAYPHPQS